MLRGFEEITVELSEEEINYAYAILPLLTDKDKENSISERTISSTLRSVGISGMSGPRLRKAIQYLRQEGFIILATGKGYYTKYTDDQMRDYLESLRQRIASIYSTYQNIRRSYEREQVYNANKLSSQESTEDKQGQVPKQSADTTRGYWHSGEQDTGRKPLRKKPERGIDGYPPVHERPARE